MLWVIFSKPEKWGVFRKRLFDEIQLIGINSIPIVGLMSIFMGAVIALQTASNMDSPLLPEYTIGYITRSSTILEFSPTMISLICKETSSRCFLSCNSIVSSEISPAASVQILKSFGKSVPFARSLCLAFPWL